MFGLNFHWYSTFLLDLPSHILCFKFVKSTIQPISFYLFICICIFWCCWWSLSNSSCK